LRCVDVGFPVSRNAHIPSIILSGKRDVWYTTRSVATTSPFADSLTKLSRTWRRRAWPWRQRQPRRHSRSNRLEHLRTMLWMLVKKVHVSILAPVRKKANHSNVHALNALLTPHVQIWRPPPSRSVLIGSSIWPLNPDFLQVSLTYWRRFSSV
jgi:hypothetical protein